MTDPMTPERLAEVEARANAATLRHCAAAPRRSPRSR